VSVIAYADLHGFGAREGLPVTCTWEPPPPEPTQIAVAAASCLKSLVSLLLLLPLFLLRQNRGARAWWIWPATALSALLGTGMDRLLGPEDWVLAQGSCAFAAGLTGLWLIMPWLVYRYRFFSFCVSLVALIGFCLLAFLPTFLGGSIGWLDMRPYVTIALALASLATLLALTVSGLFARRRFGRVRYLFELMVWMFVVWALISAPFVVYGSRNGEIQWLDSLLALLYLTAICLLQLVPFVLLSYWQPLYRDRMFEYLRLPRTEPPVIPPAPPVLSARDYAGQKTGIGGAGG
jgi:hypothetical protein